MKKLIAAMLIALTATFFLALGCKDDASSPRELVLEKVWWTPSRPSAGQDIVFHARLLNRGDTPFPADSQINVGIALDGRLMGAMPVPSIGKNSTLDLESDRSANGVFSWDAQKGPHFVVAALVNNDNQALPESVLNSALKARPETGDQRVRIMCLGDSITGGSHSSTSYRYYLYKSLMASGYTNFTFVGSLTGVTDPAFDPPADWEQHHEGHPGWSAAQIVEGDAYRTEWIAGKLSGPGGWAKVYRPEIALIDLGLNDLSQGHTPRQAVAAVARVIDTLRAANTRIQIALAAVTPEWNREPGYGQIGEFNALLRTMALKKTTLTSPIYLVDLNTGIDVDSDLVDGVHPNDGGHQKLSERWLPIVQQMIDRAILDRRHRKTIRFSPDPPVHTDESSGAVTPFDQ